MNNEDRKEESISVQNSFTSISRECFTVAIH